MSSLTHLARAVASAFLSGEWHVRVMMARAAFACTEPPLRTPDSAMFTARTATPEFQTHRHDWVRTLAFQTLELWEQPPLSDAEPLIAWLAAHPILQDAWMSGAVSATPRLLSWQPQMDAARWPVRALHTFDDVRAWLNVDDGQLEWLADRRGLLSRAEDERLQHYTWRWVARGERLPRLIEAPKQHLKSLQRRVLEDVLSQVPAHEAAHGFVRGRGVKTHAAIHAGQRLVVRFDLEAFFTWVQPVRAHRLFRALGYPRAVASLLVGLCTTQTPERVLRAAPRPADERSNELFQLQRRLAQSHLPQGAPTSPSLANLTCWSLDVRLTNWAERVGATYSRYADDLVFSGSSSLSVGGLTRAVSAICRDEGFRVNAAKTRVMHAHRRQQVTGLVVNQGVAVPRAQRDALEAQLFNLARGRLLEADVPLTALRAHLEGRVSWVGHAHPKHATWLRELLARIDWTSLG
jgi:hypothetical protein